jgi:hypothetical protein
MLSLETPITRDNMAMSMSKCSMAKSSQRFSCSFFCHVVSSHCRLIDTMVSEWSGWRRRTSKCTTKHTTLSAEFISNSWTLMISADRDACCCLARDQSRLVCGQFLFETSCFTWRRVFQPQCLMTLIADLKKCWQLKFGDFSQRKYGPRTLAMSSFQLSQFVWCVLLKRQIFQHSIYCFRRSWDEKDEKAEQTHNSLFKTEPLLKTEFRAIFVWNRAHLEDQTSIQRECVILKRKSTGKLHSILFQTRLQFFNLKPESSKVL